jgi:hypothetical protein
MWGRSKINKDRGMTFYCFSPPVMIATCIIELSLLAYTFWRYKFNGITRLSVLLLLFLALFQLAEFRVCTGSTSLVQWSHVGYVAITLLPPLGIHLITLLRRKKGSSPIVWTAYTTGLAFVLYFALTANSLNGHACEGNYVIFQVNPSLTWLYALYYYGWVIAGMIISMMYARQAKLKRQRQAFYGFAAGYAAFLVPTTTANLLNSATRAGIPSIMCGFAVLFALILTLSVLPRVATIRKR